jgi:hypothetical protein
MKRLLILALLLSTTSAGLYAQEFGIGGRIGFSTSTLLTDDAELQAELTFVGGGQVDVYAYKMFNEWVGIEGGLMFTQAGTAFTDGDSEVKTTYLAIPLSVRFKWGYFTLNPGIRPSFLSKAEWDGEDITDQINSTDVGFFVSPGLQFPVGITLNSTFYMGLSDVFSNIETVNRNFVLQLSVGYTFFRNGG